MERIIKNLKQIGLVLTGAITTFGINKALDKPFKDQEDLKQKVASSKLENSIKETIQNEGEKVTENLIAHNNRVMNKFEEWMLRWRTDNFNTPTSLGDNTTPSNPSAITPEDQLAAEKILERLIRKSGEGVRHQTEMVNRIQEDKYADVKSFENDTTIARDNMKSMESDVEELTKIVKRSSMIDLQPFYDFLDSLSIFELTVLMNVTYLSTILLTVLHTLAILFSNELIIYFNLEARFPRLAFLMRLRDKVAKFQIAFNVLLIVVICLVGLVVNFLMIS